MGNRVCPDCGEEFSTTYRKCPFCEEEAAFQQGAPIHRRGGKRLEKRRTGGGVGGVLLLLLGVVVLGMVGFALMGDRIADTMGIRGGDPLNTTEPSGANAISQPENDQPAPPEDTVTPITVGDGGESGEEGDDGNQAEPTPLALSQANIQIAAGDKARLLASGGTGEVVWSTSNENIATVTGGEVEGKAGGTATITAACGEESVSCTVKVTGDPYVSNLDLKLNKTDFTLPSGDPPVQMKVLISGTSDVYDGQVTWSTGNANVVTVSDGGLVTRVGKGTTTVTAAVEGQELECTVRVP